MRGERARDWGLTFGDIQTGPTNTLLDVPGLRVGHATVRTSRTLSGVTAVLPSTRDLCRAPVTAAHFAGNGFGKAVGTTQVAELGRLETPLLLTGTLSTFAVADATVRWVLDRPGHERLRSVNPVVAETNDNWWASDHHAGVVTEEDVRNALQGMATPATLEGCRGAGAGTVAFGFKSGIGSSSRRVMADGRAGVIGCMVQANHSGRLPGTRVTPGSTPLEGSVVVVLVSDVPFSSRQLSRIARRGVYALARTGADFAHGSGDYAFAISVGDDGRVSESAIDACVVAVQDLVDEAVWNALVTAEDTTVGDTSYRALTRSDLAARSSP